MASSAARARPARSALVVSVPFALTAWAMGEERAWFMYMVLPLVVALSTYVILSLEVAALSFSPLEAAVDASMFSLLLSAWAVFPVSFLASILAFRAR